ncbi:MAG: zinc-dependent metalloprotease [Candidatus Eremiobacteraeota bacterium]|nr:zinc-dependent metalloprotease [Candidatus Eremiobacteraeota bacterium]
MRVWSIVSAAFFAVAVCARAAGAAPPSGASPGPAGSAASQSSEAASGPAAYARVIKDAEKQVGLFTIYREQGRVALELQTSQFDRDFLEHVVPANGLGGFGFHSGDMFAQEARVVHFHQDGSHVAMIWPHTRFIAAPGTPLGTAVRESTADSVQAVLSVIAEDKTNGKVLVDLSPLLGDTLDLGNTLSDTVKNEENPQGAYRLDPTRTYFGATKAFPKNVIIEADETFASAKPDMINTVPDARFVQMRVKYNLADILSSPDYMPRLYDDRVGFWEDPHIGFGNDTTRDNYLWYVLRWNLQPSDPSRGLSPAKKPIVFYLDNSIPTEYRAPVREGILEWNKAFQRIGIADALQVRDAPNDRSWDPDDIRYNVIRWVTDEKSEFGAEAQIIWDPRTGEIFRGGVLLDSNLVRTAKIGEKILLGPLASVRDDVIVPVVPNPGASTHDERLFAAGEQREAAFGETALEMTGSGMSLDRFSRDRLKAVVMHEVGHDFGLSHNFIGHNAYTTSQVKSNAFTLHYGTTSSVMEYWPVNIWPRGQSRGTFYPLTLGTYDYHAIHWGYAAVPGARSPQAEVPTLARWASVWSDSRYSFAGDEDGFFDGHAVDPRTAPFMLTDRPIDWCDTQLRLTKGLVGALDRHFPRAQAPWDDQRFAFLALMSRYNTCASSMMHYMAGEYLSRARVGDFGARPPLTAVPRPVEQRAFSMLDRYLFSDSAWRFSPTTLRRLVYTEYMPFANFGYDPTPRHDVSVSQLAAKAQNAALAYMFSPLVLQRLADLPMKAQPGATMTTADLFVWTQRSIFGDLDGSHVGTTEVHRNLQRRYARFLAHMAVEPTTGTPYDAQAMAHHELVALSHSIKHALRLSSLNVQTRAHLEAMQLDVNRALEARQVISG